jgi:hypothetical protein
MQSGACGWPQQAGPGDRGQQTAADPTEAARGRELDARLRAVLDRVGRKNELTRRLIDGTATLAEAAAAFADLNRQDPAVAEMLRLRHPGLSEDERPPATRSATPAPGTSRPTGTPP